MADNEPTLLAVVERVIDVISDAISNLLGQVVVLQEKNAPIPAALPKTGRSVVEACDRLVAVAKELASDEYEDFPTIEKEIVDASNDVSEAADALEKAIKNLQTSKDRQGGWARLVDSCKVIAEMTVLLLQIVYGAEVKRIFALQKRAEQQVVAVDVEMVSENKKHFAEVASAAASAAVELANSIRDKANEQALPVKRDALLQLADALEQQAKDVMDRANELLRLPGDQGRRDKLDDALTKLKKTMKAALVPLQEDYVAACQAQKWTFEGPNAQQVQRMTTDPADRKRAIDELIDAIKAGDKPRIREALDRVEWELDNVQNLAKRVMGVRPEASEALEQFNLKRRGLRPAVKEAEKEGVPKLEGFWADLMDAQAKLMDEIVPIEDRVAQLVQEQLGDMDRIKKALRDGGDPSIVRITKNVFGTHKDLMKAAEKCHNGWKKGKPKRMRECLTAANGVLGGYIKGVQTSVKDPNARDRTYQDSQDLALAVEDVCAEALPIEEALIMAGDLQIHDLRGQHDPNRANWNELQDTIEKRGPKFERLAKEAKDWKEEEAARRKLKIGKGKIPDNADVEEELRKLRKVAGEQQEVARDQGPDWLRTNLRHVEAVQDAVAAALSPKSRLVYLANKALEDLKLGSDADSFSRGPGQALSHHLEGVVEECGRVAGAMADPSARERLKKLAAQVDPILEGLHSAAARATRNPNDADAQREFAKLNHRLGDLTRQIIQDVVFPTAEIQHLAERVTRGLDNQLNLVPTGKKAEVEAQNEDLEEATARLADLADFAAQHSKDYAAKHRIRGAAGVLKRDPPEHAKHSLRAVETPKEKEPVRDLKTVDRRIRNAVETLVGDTATPEAQLSTIARQLIKHIDELTEGVRDGGDAIDVPTMAGVEGALVKRLGAKVDLIKEKMNDPAVAKQLQKAMKDVHDLTPHHLAGVHQVMVDTESKENQQQLTTDAQALKDAVLAVMSAAQSSPEEELRALRKIARDALLEGSGKAQRGEGPTAEAKGVEAAKAYSDMDRHARDVAARVNPASRAGTLESEAFEVRNAADDAPDALRAVSNDGGAPESLQKNHAAAFVTDSMSAAVDRDAAARMKSEARKLQRALAGVAAALQKGDPKEVASGMQEASKRFGELAQLAEAEAKSLGGKDEQAMLDVVALLKDGVPTLSDKSVDAMESNWDPATTAPAVEKAHRLGALAGSLADGTFKEEAQLAGSEVPKDDRRGKRLWNVASPDFVGQDELDAAAKLESMLPALKKGPPEQVLLDAEKQASQLGQHEPSPGERLGQLARLAELDLQHLVDCAADGKDVPLLPELLNSTAETLQRAVDAYTPSLLSSDQVESVKLAAKTAAKAVPEAVSSAKKRNAEAMQLESVAAQLALDVVAEAFDPTSDLTLFELRDRAAKELDSLQQGGTKQLADLDKLTAIRLPLMRALGVAMRRVENLPASLKKKAEELGRLWVSLPDAVRKGDDVSETARRMNALLDELMEGTHAFAVGLAQRIESDLGPLQLAVADEDQSSAQELAQGIVSDLKDLEAYIFKMPDASAELKQAVKDAKAASVAVIKKVPECLQGKEPQAELASASSQLKAAVAGVVAKLWSRDPSAAFLHSLREAEAALDRKDLSAASKHAAGLGEGEAADAARHAIKRCGAAKGGELEAALANARRKLRAVGGRSAERVRDADGALDRARAQWATEALRVRRGGGSAGAVEAAKRLIDGTRSKYKKQDLESFDLSRLNAAAQKAKPRAPRSLADVLAEIRKGRYERQKKREEKLAEAKPLNIKPGQGAFSAMQNDVDQNLKQMVVGSPLDFEGDRTVQLVRTITGDFATIGQHAASKQADQMIAAGKEASKHISELAKELTALAKRTPDRRAADELARSANVLKDFAVRSKLFTSIQAASLKTKGGEDSMLSFSKELSGSILTCLKVFYVARIKIYEAEKKK